MKFAVASCVISVMGMLPPATWAGTEGSYSTFYGISAGQASTNDPNANTFVGSWAGKATTSGTENAFLGKNAGLSNVGGSYNTYLGGYAGQNNVSGSYNTYVGHGTGLFGNGMNNSTLIGAHAGQNTSGNYNTFLGSYSGYTTTGGAFNTFLGTNAGYYNTTGGFNTFLGGQAGVNNITGESNVFIGNAAGYTETGSHKLYIDNCFSGNPCTSPLIYGEFNNHRIRLNGMTEVHFDGQPKSQLNFSQSSTDTGGYLTSVLDNNFFMSSGARYDGTLAAPNQWVQRSSDGNSVIQGSGGLGYRIFTSSGQAQNSAFFPTVRLHINYNGEFGINGVPVAGHEIHTSSGAYLASGTWTNASSRDYKERIEPLSVEAAAQALAALNPVTYAYKDDADQQRVGFIAEDVPDLVAMKDRKGLSPMDIVAVLTKVLQQKSQIIDEQARRLAASERTADLHRRALDELREAVASLQRESRRRDAASTESGVAR
jgi:hypothetical protein